MKRKILYIGLVLIFAIGVGFFSSGCTGQSEKKEEAKAAFQQGKEVAIASESESNTGAAVAAKIRLKNTTESATTGKESGLAVENTKKQVTISVSCNTIYDNLKNFDQSKVEILPKDGWIVPETKVDIEEGETVFDVLLKVTKDKNVHMEYVSTPLYKSNYIEGIGNIYEIDCGPLSGWMYKVNKAFPNYGCGGYIVKDGDQIEWVYTCDLGRDVGGDWNEQNK